MESQSSVKGKGGTYENTGGVSMIFRRECPLIVQGDQTVLLEADHPSFQRVRDDLSSFAELIKSPDFLHTYRITPLSLWNAAASGIDTQWILSFLGERKQIRSACLFKKRSGGDPGPIRFAQVGDIRSGLGAICERCISLSKNKGEISSPIN